MSDRSRLYNIEPIGVGTEHIESLTSYISRLAEKHGVLTGILISKEITPVLNKKYLLNIAKNGGNRFYENATAINGLGETAICMVNAIERLTTRGDLSSLTFLNLSEVVPQKNLFSKYKKWCSDCLYEWQLSGKEQFEPLIWSIKSLKICKVHSRKLDDVCPNCKKGIPLFTRKSRVGHCSYCGSWLAHNINKYKEEFSEEEYNWQQWLYDSIGELLLFPNEITRVELTAAITRYIDKVTQGNITKFAKLLGKPNTTVNYWYNKETIPVIEDLIKIMYLTKTSFVDFLNKKNVIFEPQLLRNSKMKKDTKYSRIEKDKIKEQLDRILIIESTYSLNKVAEILNVSTKSLKKYFPDYCRKITFNYKQEIEKNRRIRLEKSKNSVQYITAELFNKGIYPSRRRVEEALNKSAILREREIQIFWKEKLAQLYNES